MSRTIGEALFRVRPDMSGFGKEAAQGAEQNLTRAGRSAGEKSGKETSRSYGRSFLAGMGGIITGGLVLDSVKAVGRGVKEMVGNAVADAAAQRRLAVALRNTAGARRSDIKGVESWISKMGVATGITDDEMRPALQRLVQTSGSIAKGQRLLKLGFDVSAGSGKSLEQVTTALSKAQAGNMGALSRLGVRIKDSSGKALTFNQVVKQLGDTFGGQAKAKANSFEGQMSRLSLIWDEAKESVGSKLLPVLTSLGAWFLGQGLPAIQRFSAQLSSGQGSVGQFASSLRSIGTALLKVGSFLIGNKEAVGTFVGVALAGAAAVKLWAIAQAVLNVALTANPIGLVIVGLAALAAGFVLLWKKSTTFRNVVTGALRAVATVGRWLWNGVFQPVVKFIVTGLSLLMKIWGKMLSALGHVPGFGWAKAAGKAMSNAADDARRLASNIKAIKDKKVTVTTVFQRINAAQGKKNQDLLGGHRASGGLVYRGRGYEVGEHGRELFVPGTTGRIVSAHALRVATADRVGTRAGRLGAGGGVDVDALAEALARAVVAAMARSQLALRVGDDTFDARVESTARDQVLSQIARDNADARVGSRR